MKQPEDYPNHNHAAPVWGDSPSPREAKKHPPVKA